MFQSLIRLNPFPCFVNFITQQATDLNLIHRHKKIISRCSSYIFSVIIKPVRINILLFYINHVPGFIKCSKQQKYNIVERHNPLAVSRTPPPSRVRRQKFGGGGHVIIMCASQIRVYDVLVLAIRTYKYQGFMRASGPRGVRRSVQCA